MHALRLSFILLMTMLSSCSTSITHYEGTQPEFKLEEFFNGELSAYGIVQDRSGKVLRRFNVKMTGSWEQNKGTLDEHFVYDDGEKQRRIWHLTKLDEGQYAGTASDVTKDALGQTNGFALNWQYTLAIEVEGKTWNINFDDWMYLLDEQRLINRAKMSKWGFTVGEVTLFIEKH